MAYTYQTATLQQIEDWEVDGTLQRLYDESENYIDNNNFTFGEDWTRERKRDFFINRFKAVASDNVVGVPTQQHKVIACFDDDKLIGLHQGFYDSADTSWSMCIALIGNNKSNSRAYIYERDYTLGFNNYCKTFGATKLHIFCEEGSQVAFRFASLVSYGDLSDCYDENIAQSEVIDVHYYYERPAQEIIPTADGQTGTEPAKVQEDRTVQSQRFTLTYK